MYIDWTYIVYVLPALIFALIAQGIVKSAFAKYSKVFSTRGVTGYMAARTILDANGLSDVNIERVAGKLTDHYDPRTNCIRLSESVFDSASVGAIGVAAHEAGHAVQYATGYLPIKIRSAIIPMTNIGSTLAFPLVLIGIALSFPGLAYLGVAVFGLAVFFQLVTLPVEFNASRRAIAELTVRGTLSADELRGAQKVLTAAALTYIAALAVSLGNFLRLLSIANRSKRR